MYMLTYLKEFSKIVIDCSLKFITIRFLLHNDLLLRKIAVVRIKGIGSKLQGTVGVNILALLCKHTNTLIDFF